MIRPGDFKFICEDSGFEGWASDSVILWDGRRVLKRFADQRNPQDFVVRPFHGPNPSDTRPPPPDDEGSPTRTQPNDL